MRRFSSLCEGRWVLVGLVWLVAEGETWPGGLFLLACLLAGVVTTGLRVVSFLG
jgi:hypothetical protein